MTNPQSLANGEIGIALLHLETHNWPAAISALRQASNSGVSIGPGASLYYGAPALAYVLAGTNHPGLTNARSIAAEGTAIVAKQRLRAAHQRIDQQQQPHYAEYDLIRGLTGIGVVLRRLGHHYLLRQVLEYLVRLTESINGLPGWWCYNCPDHHKPAPEGGHANHGMAHGITGPLALLALTYRDGTSVDSQTTAITRICQWLDAWQQNTLNATWWPQTLTIQDLEKGTPTQKCPLRPSWCYGTPGITRAQQLAAIALDDPTRQQLAEDAFTKCITDPTQIQLISDWSLCHGTAGLLVTALRIAADAQNSTSVAPLLRLHEQSKPASDKSTGFLDGTTGAELATLIAHTRTDWDACLLLT